MHLPETSLVKVRKLLKWHLHDLGGQKELEKSCGRCARTPDPSSAPCRACRRHTQGQAQSLEEQFAASTEGIPDTEVTPQLVQCYHACLSIYLSVGTAENCLCGHAH